jgi:hypothetical protein
MIGNYFNAAIGQARERARQLKSMIPKPVSAPELLGLQQLCEAQLNGIADQLEYLAKDPLINRPELARERVRHFRRVRNDLGRLEATGIAALSRIQADDIFLSRLMFRVHQEVQFPLAPPMVTCLSQNYYCIIPSLRLVAVPLAEAKSLLHLPDLYHEMGHLLICAKNEPDVEKYQLRFVEFLDVVSSYWDTQRTAAIRMTGPKDYCLWVANTMEQSWAKWWAEELFCDLFATMTLGPAFVWAHFHLNAEHGTDPFGMTRGEMTHPPDNARMVAMLAGLRLLGLKDQADTISERWKALSGITSSGPDEWYIKACPDQLLRQAAEYAYKGAMEAGCRLATAGAKGLIHESLNEAWNEFWRDPSAYQKWEKARVDELRTSLQS